MGKISDNTYYERTDETILLTQRIRGDVFLIIHRFFSAHGFIYIDPPILHEQIPGKKYEVYLPLYDNCYSLNSSNALFMGAYAGLLGNVYAISPTFREEQDSVNHLLEFRMLEAEVLGMTYPELPDFVENLIKYILKELMNSLFVRSNNVLLERINNLLTSFHPRRLTYEAFVREIEHSGGMKLTDSDDLSDIDYEISNYIQEPTFIIDYPRTLATWTAKTKNAVIALAINLILPSNYGELCEGCERTNDTNYLRYKMRCAGIENLNWYLKAIANISAHRCGLGIGIDRLVRWIAGLPRITDCVLFPRIKQE